MNKSFVELTARPATALIALARAMSMKDEVDETQISQLIDAIISSKTERAALLTALRESNDGELALIVSDLLQAHAATLKNAETKHQDFDDVIGVWIQRVTTAGLLLATGAVIAGTLAGAAAGAAILIPLSGTALSAIGRLKSRNLKNALSKRREDAETLAKHASEAPKRP